MEINIKEIGQMVLTSYERGIATPEMINSVIRFFGELEHGFDAEGYRPEGRLARELADAIQYNLPKGYPHLIEKHTGPMTLGPEVAILRRTDGTLFTTTEEKRMDITVLRSTDTGVYFTTIADENGNCKDGPEAKTFPELRTILDRDYPDAELILDFREENCDHKKCITAHRWAHSHCCTCGHEFGGERE